MEDNARILIVDDDEHNRTILQYILEKLGATADLAATGQECLEKASQAEYSVALLDIRLPDIAGIDLIQKIKKIHSNIEIVMVTGYASVETAVQAMNAGASAYITKPLNMDVVLATVKNALEKQRLASEKRKAEEKVHRLLEQQIAVNRLALALGEVAEIDSAYRIIYEHVCKLMDAEAMIISFYEKEQNAIRAGYVITNGVELDVSTFPLIPLEEQGHGTQSKVIHSGQPLYVTDFRKAMEATQNEFTFESDGTLSAGPPKIDLDFGSTNSAIFVPMKIKNETVGVMQAQSLRLNAYTQDDIELLSALSNVAAVAIENARLHEQTHRNLERLSSLYNVGMVINASMDIHVTLSVLLEQAMTQLGVDAADVLLLNTHTNSLDYAAGRGFRSNLTTNPGLRLGKGLPSKAALDRQVVIAPDLAEFDSAPWDEPLHAEEGFVSYCCAPLISKGKVKGVLETFHRSRFYPDSEWLGFLDALSTQATIAIENAGLFDDLQRSNLGLSLAYDATLEGWANSLEMRIPHFIGHSQRVTDLAEKLGRALGMAEMDLIQLRRGALLHDVGMLAVPDNILLNPASLSEEDWMVIRQHPTHAYNFLAPISYLRPALDVPYCHHERWDGSGYPRGLQGESIPLSARLFAVVDVWDALLSDRPWRKAWPSHQALEHIHQQSGRLFEPYVVDQFVKLVS